MFILLEIMFDVFDISQNGKHDIFIFKHKY